MTTKMINITVPLSWTAPEIMNTLNAEENAFILNTGCEMIKEARSLVVGLSQNEIYNKIREESKSEIQKLELDLLVQKELTSSLDQSIRIIYEKQLEQMKKQIEELKSQITVYQCENKDFIKTEVEKEKEKFKIILEEKDKQLKMINETHDYIVKQNQKSTSHKGKEGEEVFEYYADETFRDFKGYSLLDRHTQCGSGDFHLQFENFDVLVDAKNYKKKVPIDQRDKIKKDLIKNEHITFAWLVSLNTSIDKYDKSPVMYEWINTKQCIVYINNLTEHEDPRKLLRIVWFTCNELFKFVKEVTLDNEELEEIKNDKFKLMDKIKNTRKRIREINTSVNNTKNLIQLMDEELKEILSNETDDIVESNYGVFDEWWDTNIELTDEETQLLSTDMWTKFKQDNKKIIKDSEITVDKFKQYIKTKLPHSKIIIKSKNSNSAYELKGLKFKDKKEEIIKKIESKLENNKIELVLNEIPILENKVDKKVSKKSKIYFDESRDNKIISEYLDQENDIISISTLNNIRPWEVVSLLVKYKIIGKRGEAKGYDKYKETEEYKNNFFK
jgi:hypothetical protein